MNTSSDSFEVILQACRCREFVSNCSEINQVVLRLLQNLKAHVLIVLQPVQYHRLLNETLSVENLASELAKTLEKRENLLKISAMNLYEIEDNSSLQRLEDYKVAFKGALDAVSKCVDKFIPEKADEKKALIQYGLFPFTYGIYPYTAPTEKQIEAMNRVGVKFQAISVYEITYRFLCQLFR